MSRPTLDFAHWQVSNCSHFNKLDLWRSKSKHKTLFPPWIRWPMRHHNSRNQKASNTAGAQSRSQQSQHSLPDDGIVVLEYCPASKPRCMSTFHPVTPKRQVSCICDSSWRNKVFSCPISLLGPVRPGPCGSTWGSWCIHQKSSSCRFASLL